MRTLAGRYGLEAVIGRGGMGTVYRATDRVLERTVAVKVLSAALAEGDATYVARFEREARAAASLTHPGIVTVYDTGGDGDERFIAMEYVDGESLSAIIAREAPLDPDRSAAIGAQVADALEAAHRAGLVHRDVKPANVMIARAGLVKVLDFGIAHAVDASPITRTGSVLGAMPYMAPEHAVGDPVDARSDVYSLGCVLYEMLAGRPPFRDVIASVFQQQRQAGPLPPREANPRVGRELDALVLQMLAQAPDERPQSAAEVRDRLHAVASSAAEAVPAGAASSAPPAGEEGTSATRVLGARGGAAGARPAGAAAARAGETWLRFAGGLLIVAVVALIAVLALVSGSSNPTHSTSTAGATTSSTTPTATSTSRTAPSQEATTPTPTQTVTVITTATAPAAGGGGAGPGATAPGPGAGPPGHAGKPHKKHGGGG